MSDKKNLLLFFDRPTEPCFMQKGDTKTTFQLPDHYFPDRYSNLSTQLSDRFGVDAGPSIPIRNIALPDLSLPMELPFHEQFSLFVPKHRTMAGKLVDIFMGMRDVDDLMSVCTYCQLRINPYMFNYCLSVAILNRPDTKGLNIPTFAETFPDKFVDPKVFKTARETTSVLPAGSRMPVVIPQNYTASDSEPEQRIAYFREDIGVNLHHWHWHLVYPFEAADRSIIDKDRRGELWYYMHQQTIARYNIERLCNDLGFVRRFDDFRQPILEGYFPKMDSQVASRSWPPRFANSRIRDLDRPVDQIKVDVQDLEIWRDRLLQAIERGSVTLPNGRQVPLDEERGIDMLANLLESSILSVNRPYYGNLHGLGHVIISYAHDPDHRHLEQFGVMGDLATTMRDPAFYLWHSYIDDILNMHKVRLTPYTEDMLNFPNIRVSSITVDGRAGSNTFQTQWEVSTLNLARGLDFSPRGSVLATFTHLQHESFSYLIECSNTSGKAVMATVRIFMAPKLDDQGRPFATFEDRRRFWLEMDKFTENLQLGRNIIRRRSTESSVTIPYERTFMDQGSRPGQPGSVEAADFDFCGCGWPQHMLIPKGTAEGYPMELFVMLSNWMDDRVVQDTIGSCNDAASFCGLRDRKYPDRRSMGYPFDRPARAGVSTIRDFLTANMTVRDCSIRFTDTVRQRGQTN